MPWASQSIRPVSHLSKHAGTPRESWWICPVEEFTARATEEWRRMKTSRFGSIQLGTESEARADRRRRLPV